MRVLTMGALMAALVLVGIWLLFGAGDNDEAASLLTSAADDQAVTVPDGDPLPTPTPFPTSTPEAATNESVTAAAWPDVKGEAHAEADTDDDLIAAEPTLVPPTAVVAPTVTPAPNQSNETVEPDPTATAIPEPTATNVPATPEPTAAPTPTVVPTPKATVTPSAPTPVPTSTDFDSPPPRGPTATPVPVGPTAIPEPPSGGPTAQQWELLRQCESSGNYQAYNPAGPGYFGAYQFDVATWNGLAAVYFPELVGINPADAAPADQDRMAFKLYETRGAQPWPVCGRHLL